MLSGISAEEACRTARLSARCPIVTEAVEYPAAIAASACRTSAAVSPRSLPLRQFVVTPKAA